MTSSVRGDAPTAARDDGLFAGAGEMRALCRAFDWSATPLGPVASWSSSLRTVVGLVLDSRNPMFLFWGPELVQFYNDAYRPSLGAGGRHPRALGMRAREFWTDIWDVIGPQIDQVMSGGEATWHVDQYLPIERNGRLEDVWWTYSYSPVRDDDGGIAGTLVVCQETTPRVVAERERERLRTETARVERRAASVLERVSDAHIAMDGDFRIMTVNAAAERALGRTRGELAGLTHWEAFPDSRGTEVERQYRRVQAERVEAHFTQHYVGDGYDAHLEVDAYPTDEGGFAIFWRDVSERVRASASLAAERARLAEVFQQAPVAIAVLRGTVAGDMVYELANPRYVEAVPAGREIVGRRLRDVLPEIETAIFGILQRVLDTGEPFVSGDIAVPLDRDGDGATEEYMFNVVYHPLVEANGAVNGIVSVGTEVTAFVRAQQAAERAASALAASEAQFRLLIEEAAEAVFVADATGRYTDVNRRGVELLGYSREALLDRTLADLALPEDLPALDALVQRLRAAPGRAEVATWRLRHADGSIVPVELSATLLTDGRLQGLARDLRPRLAAEAERALLLAASETARQAAEADAARMAALQAATAALAGATSFEDLGRIIRDAAATTLGAAAGLIYRLGEERLGEDGATLYAALIDDAGGFGAEVPQRWSTVPLDMDAGVAEVVRTGASIFQATPAERARRYPHLMSQSTSTTFASWAFLPLLVEGRSVGSLALAWTAPQRGGEFPEAVRALATVLAAQCAVSVERVRLYAAEHAARERAEAAQVEAEAANRAKGEFLAVMSHELRTPLNAIGGYAELMELGIHGPVTPEQRTALDRIQRSQRALLSLINEVLNYARLETGAVTYALADVPVADAVGAAELLVAPQLRAKGLRFGWDGCDAGLAVRADPDKLQQVLRNLLSNAVKFTEARDGAGRVEVSCAMAGPDMVAIRVRDTGIGIAADKLEAIFEPFVQVDARLTRPHEGTGLGLAISRDLARGMGGELTAESVPGVGSTFSLVLPRADG